MENAAPPSEPLESTGFSAEPLAARIAAFLVLRDVLERRQPLDSVLETTEAFSSLPSRDKAFARMIAATALRRLGQIDDLIARAADRGQIPQPQPLQTLLRLAVAQIAFMNAPDYAVVDTAVQIAAQNGMERQKGFVNAVLRRVAENRNEWLAQQDPLRLNTPEWLMKLWIADYGLRQAAEIAQANLSEAPLDISLKDPSEMHTWADTLGAVILPTGSLRLSDAGAVQNLPGYDDGMWWVQDAAAALPAQLFGDIAGRTVLDMCAAPGGKTAQLVTLGASVHALDRSTKRLQRLRANLRRLRLEEGVTLETADAGAWRSPRQFDYILLDAPCTATGTARRHPDVLRLKTPQDMKSLMDTQARLLDNAALLLAPDGILIYCTCSLQKDESENQIARFLAAQREFCRLPFSAAEAGGMETLLTPEGDIRVLPFHMAVHGGMDGFYIARLQKIPDNIKKGG